MFGYLQPTTQALFAIHPLHAVDSALFHFFIAVDMGMNKRFAT